MISTPAQERRLEFPMLLFNSVRQPYEGVSGTVPATCKSLLFLGNHSEGKTYSSKAWNGNCSEHRSTVIKILPPESQEEDD